MIRKNLYSYSVLIVDANQHMRKIIKDLLHSFGVKKVFESDDSADAFSDIKHLNPDAIICSYNVEPVNGVEFTKLVRTASDIPKPSVPIIMLTGQSELNIVVESRDAGVTEFLTKPVSATSLNSRLIAVFERPRVFIKEKSYRGPDRRRQKNKLYSGKERRSDREPGEING